jgi:hypothetical protein
LVSLLPPARFVTIRTGLFFAGVLLAISAVLGANAANAFTKGSTDITLLYRPLAFFIDVPFFLTIIIIFFPRYVLKRKTYLG